jgi:hypothetical protein
MILSTLTRRIFAVTLAALFLLRGVVAQGPTYSPLRPPAIPLAVRNPYTHVWAANTDTGGTLNTQNPSFWTSDAVGWEGIVVVDDTAYEYLGSTNSELPNEAQYVSAVPQNVSFDSQSSNFTFRAGPVTVEASFFSPVTPKDECRSSIPLSYLTTTAWSNVSLSPQKSLIFIHKLEIVSYTSLIGRSTSSDSVLL